MIVVNLVGEDPRSSQAGAGVEDGRLGDHVEIVSQAEIQSEVVPHTPFILGEGRIFLKIGIGSGSGSARASERLHEGIRRNRGRSARRRAWVLCRVGDHHQRQAL